MLGRPSEKTYETDTATQRRMGLWPYWGGPDQRGPNGI